MSSEHKNQYSDDVSSEQSGEEQLIKEEFLEIFQEGVDPNLCFYKAYCKLHLENLKLLEKVEQMVEENKQLDKKAKQVGKHSSAKEQQLSHEDRKKRSRRTAGQIARHYTCNYEICQKSYGSQGSLNQHIKLKHNGIPFCQ